jgi:septum formation topological specificity factor MinE
MTTERKPIKKTKKPPTPKDKGEVRSYAGVECNLSPRVVKYCKNLIVNGGIKAKAARDAGLASTYPYSDSYKRNKYIPIYLEQLRKEILEFGGNVDDNETSENYVEHIRKHIGRNLLKRYVDIANFNVRRIIKTRDKNGIEYLPDDQISPEDHAAIANWTVETTEYGGKNPRKTTKIKPEIYDSMKAMESLQKLIGIDYKKGQDAEYLIDQLKNMLVDQKKTGIFPTMPTPETEPALLLTKEEEEGQVPMSDVTRH